MSNINDLVFFESKKHKHDDDLPSKGEVGAGFGKYIGSSIGHAVGGPAGSPIGYGVGYYIGKHHIMKHPKEKMDKRSAIDRTGAMLNNSSKLKNIGIKVAGAALGAIAGHHASVHLSGHRPGDKNAHAGGAVLGAAIGSQLAHHLLGAGRENRKLAKKLGYGHLGRAAASVSPLTGMFKPHDQIEDD